MHDINTISRLNAEATASDVPKQRAAGKYVVCTYAGLNYLQHESFKTRDEAHIHTALHAEKGHYGERTEILAPTNKEPAEALTS